MIIRPIGKPQKKLRDSPEVLSWVLTRLRQRRLKGVELPDTDLHFVRRISALVILMRAAASHAKAIRATARLGVAESGIVNLRTMLELWSDFRLIAGDRTNGKLREMYVAGALALLRKSPNAAVEASVEQEFPEEFAMVKARLAKKPFGHWTGGSRKAEIAKSCGSLYGDLYEFLSWDSHPILQIVLDLQTIDSSKGRFEARHRVDQHQVARTNCTHAAHIVRDMWNALCAEVAAKIG